MEPMERRAGILDALRSLLIRRSNQGPVVMVIEDLHWVDEKSEEAIAALVDVVASARVLIVLSYRPGYTHSLGDRAYYSRIALPEPAGRGERRTARERPAVERLSRTRCEILSRQRPKATRSSSKR